MLVASSHILNKDIKNKCELFHRSLPVSIWKIVASRFIIGIGGFIVVSLVLGIIHYLVLSLLFLFNFPIKMDWWLGLNGFLLGWAHLAIAMLVAGSINGVLSATFKEYQNMYIGLGVLGIEVVTRTLNYLYGLGIPSLFISIRDLVFSGFYDVQRTAVGISSKINCITVSGLSESEVMLKAVQLPESFLSGMWATLFSWSIGFKLLFAALMFVLATAIYHRREVTF